MRDFATTNTRRAKLYYQGPSGRHVTMLRFKDDVTETRAYEACVGFVNAVKVHQYNEYVWTEMWFALRNDEVFVPQPWDAIQATGDPNGQPLPVRANVFSIIGRSVGGSRVSWLIHGSTFGLGLKYRILAAASPAVSALITAINTLPDLPCAIDEGTVILKNYVNLKMHDVTVGNVRNSI
jgi:hypothetical protein